MADPENPWANHALVARSDALKRVLALAEQVSRHPAAVLIVGETGTGKEMIARSIHAEKLGFKIDFLHGMPPFYGAVSRDGACLHLRFVHRPFFAQAAAKEGGLICAFIEVSNLRGLFEEFKSRDVEFAQRPTKQAWGGTDFHVRDPDDNVICFVTYE